MPPRPPPHRLPTLSKNHDASFRHLLVGAFPRFPGASLRRRRFARLLKVLWRGRFNTEVRPRKRNKGMTALIKRKSHGPWKRASGRGDNALQLIANLGTDRAVDRRVRALRFALHDRRPGIGGDADRHVQRDLAQKRHRKPLRLMPRPAMTEDIRARAAMRTLEIAHILD